MFKHCGLTWRYFQRLKQYRSETWLPLGSFPVHLLPDHKPDTEVTVSRKAKLKNFIKNTLFKFTDLQHTFL